MTVSITVDGVGYDVPASASDTNWAPKQVAFEQALATAINTALSGGSTLPDASGSVRGAVSIGTQTFGGAKTFASVVVDGSSTLHEVYLTIPRLSNASDETGSSSPVSLPSGTICGMCRIPSGQTAVTLTCADKSAADLYPWAIVAWPLSIDATAKAFSAVKSGTNDYVITVDVATTANMDFGFFFLWP